MDEEFSDTVDMSSDVEISDSDSSADITEDITEDDIEDASDDISDIENVGDNVAEDEIIDEDISGDIEEDISESDIEEVQEDISDTEDVGDDVAEDEIIDEDISGDIEEDISGNDIEDISEDISDTEDVGDDVTEDEIIDEDISGDTEEDISGNDIEDISEDISDTENVGDDVAEDEIIDENVTGDISGDIEEDISEDDIIDPETNEAADIEDEVLNTGDEVVDAEGEDIGDGEIDTEVDEVADEETDITDVDVEDKEPDAESEGIGDEVIDTEVDGVADEEIDMQNVDTESEVLNAESEDIGDEVIATEADEVADEETDMEDVDIEDKESDAESEGIGDEVIDTGVDEVADEETDITDVDIEDKEPDAESEGIGDEVIDTEVDEVADEEIDMQSVDAENEVLDVVAEVVDAEMATKDIDATDKMQDAEVNAVENAETDANNTPIINSVYDYMAAHNYGIDDFATYSQDPQWRQLMHREYPDYKMPEMTQKNAKIQLLQYMNEHNYGIDDFAEYSQDFVWRELHSTAFPDNEFSQVSNAESERNKEFPILENADSKDLNLPGGDDSENNPFKYLDDIDDSQLFGGFGTDKRIDGSDSFVKGENYEQFKKDYYYPKESSYEVYNVSKEVEISPSMIEGIHLGEHELEKPDVFWSQHEKNGTLESFKEVASHIPDVKEQLASGRTIDELLADSELSECADVYFMNKPKVIENDGYYEFDSNGRHRILAARAAGYDIPVEVIGRRYRNEDVELQDIDADVSELHVNMEGELSEQTAGENKEFGSFFDKIQNFFNPSKNSDLIDHSVADDSDSNQDIQTQWRPPAIQGADVKEPEADITPLDSTRQTINLVELPDGSKARVFDHPSDLKNILPFSQGKNEYSKSGTCALADTGVWLKIAGSKHVENDVVGFASTHADRRGQPLCSRSGGTLPSNIPDIWEHFGIPAYSDGSRSLENIAEAVESGKAVSVGVNAGMLWELDNVEGIKLSKECYGDGGANHAIGIMSCERDSLNGNITHFYINDTGRTYERDACRKINVDDFWKAFNVKRACATISQKPVW